MEWTTTPHKAQLHFTEKHNKGGTLELTVQVDVRIALVLVHICR